MGVVTWKTMLLRRLPKTAPQIFSRCARPFSTAPGKSRLTKDDDLTLEDFAIAAQDGTDMKALAAKKRKNKKVLPKPSWLRVPAIGKTSEATFHKMRDTVREHGLATVCEEARCPNIGECWGGNGDGGGTATIMLMGDTCTRGCRFCSIKTAKAPPPLDVEEPRKIAESIAKWDLGYVVLTSVDRDDLPDGGSGHIASCVSNLKVSAPDVLVEVLSPDFQGNMEHVNNVASSGLDVFAHNVETVERMTGRVRDHRAGYRQTMDVLAGVKGLHPDLVTKTSIMLGVGERDDEIRQCMRDLLDAGVEILTLGQYLRPTSRHLKVAEYVTPEKFDQWREEGEAMGFRYVASGPLVRSSYRAGEFFVETMLKERKVKSSQ